MSLTAKDIAAKVKDLASLPEVCVRLNQLMEQPDVSVAAVAQVIENDISLAARLLRVANSALFGYQGRIDSITRAVMMLGTNQIRDLMWATASTESLAKLKPHELDLRAFWQHSLYTALTARLLATKCKYANRERLFVAGLLHDIGRLVMYHVLSDEMHVVKMRMASAQETPQAAERHTVGVDHSDVGAALLAQWQFPDTIVTSVMHHHKPQVTTKFQMEAALVHIADAAAKQAGYAGYAQLDVAGFEAEAWRITGLNERILESIAPLVEKEFADAQGVYLGFMGLAA